MCEPEVGVHCVHVAVCKEMGSAYILIDLR